MDFLGFGYLLLLAVFYVLLVFGAVITMLSLFTSSDQGLSALIFSACGFGMLSITLVMYTLYSPGAADETRVVVLFLLGISIAASRTFALWVILSKTQSLERAAAQLMKGTHH